MKKVILFSAVALSAVLLAGCSDKGKTSEPKLYNPNSAQTTSTSESNVESGYPTGQQETDEWVFHYDKELGGIVIDKCKFLKAQDGRNIDLNDDSKNKDVVVPDSFEGFEGLKVVGIGKNVFRYMQCKTFTLPEGIVSVDEEAFYAFHILEGTFKFPETVTQIGKEQLRHFSELCSHFPLSKQITTKYKRSTQIERDT